jgi:hypothetical protein
MKRMPLSPAMHMMIKSWAALSKLRCTADIEWLSGFTGKDQSVDLSETDDAWFH